MAQALKIPLAGIRFIDGSSFNYRGYSAYLWSLSAFDATSAYYRVLNFGRATVYRSSNNRNYGYSVRCLKGDTPNCGAGFTWNGNACVWNSYPGCNTQDITV
jgi:hypothetical protein